MNKEVYDNALKLSKELGYDIDSILGTYAYLCQHKEYVGVRNIWEVVDERIRNFNFMGGY